jgi:nucleoside-diphosphate-sugar epimerase
VYGSGEQTRDFTWVEDAVEASIRIGENVKGFEIFNISNESEMDIATLAGKILTITNSSSKITYINAPAKRYDYEVGRRFGSSQKLFNKVNYRPNTSTDKGLKDIYEYLVQSKVQ